MGAHSPESLKANEQYERKSESARVSVPTASAPPVPPPISSSPASSTNDAVTSATTVKGPAEAKDIDLIEKEWVTKAKEILEETKEDPYIREERVKDLQADYLQKRYNRKLGDNN